MLVTEIIIIFLLLLIVFLLCFTTHKLSRLLNNCSSSQDNRPDNTICRYFHSTKKRKALTPHQKALKAWQDKGK